MEPIIWKSSSSDAVVEFHPVEQSPGCLVVKLHARDHSAQIEVYAVLCENRDLIRLFDEAALQWRGWQGKKSWRSLEGEMSLDLSMDRCGHVTLGLLLRQEFGGPDQWHMYAEITRDAGQLEQMARDVAGLWGIPKAV